MAARVGGVQIAFKANTKDAITALKALSRQFQNIQLNFQTTEKAAKQAGAAFKDLSSAATAFGAGFAALNLGGQIKDATLLAGRVESLGTVVENVGKIAGFTAPQLRLIEQRTKALGITTQATRRAIAQLAQANLDLRQTSKLARIAQDAAVIAGVNSSEAFERLVVSIQRNDVRLLRNLGIVINLNTVYQKFARETGRTAQSLTSFEKRQLLLNEVMDRGRLIAGTYESALQDVFKRFSSLERKTEEFQKTLGEEFLPLFRLVVDETDAFLSGKSATSKFLTAEVLATAATFTTVATAVAAAGAAAAVFGTALGAALGPVGLLAISIGAIAASMQNAAASAERFTKEREEAKNAGEELATTLAEADKPVAALQRLSKEAELNKEQFEELQSTVDELVVLFPKFTRELLQLRDAGNALKVLNLLADIDPRVFDSLRNRVKNANREINKNVRLLQEVVDIASTPPAEGFADSFARDAFEKPRIDAAAFVTQLQAAIREGESLEAVVERNRSSVRFLGARAREIVDALLSATAAARSFRDAVVNVELQVLEARVKAINRAAEISATVESQLQNDRLKQFDGTNVKIIEKFQEFQNKLSNVSLLTEQEIEERKQAIRLRAEADALNTFRETQARIQKILIEAGRTREAEDAARAAEDAARDVLAVKRVEAIAKAERDTVALRLQQAQVEKGFTISVEQATEALNRQGEEIRILEEGIELLGLGIDRNLITLFRKGAKELNKFENASEELGRKIKKTREEISELLGAREPDQGAINALLRQLTVFELALETTERRISTTRLKLQTETDNAVVAGKRAAKDKIVSILTEIGSITKQVNITSLDELQKFSDAVDRNTKSVQTFITGLRASEAGFTGFAEVEKQTDSLVDNLAKATSPEQIRRLRELGGRQIERSLNAANIQIQKNRLARERDRASFKDDERIRREALQFQEDLLRRGVDLQTAQQRAAAFSLQQRRFAVEQAKNETRELQEQQKLQKEERRNGISRRKRIKKAVEDAEARLKIQKEQGLDEKTLAATINGLEKEKLGLLDEELAKQQMILGVLQQIKEAGGIPEGGLRPVTPRAREELFRVSPLEDRGAPGQTLGVGSLRGFEGGVDKNIQKAINRKLAEQAASQSISVEELIAQEGALQRIAENARELVAKQKANTKIIIQIADETAQPTERRAGVRVTGSQRP